MSKFKPSNRPALHIDKESVSDKIKTGNFKISFAYFDPARCMRPVSMIGRNQDC